jgi:hypothetical protein
MKNKKLLLFFLSFSLGLTLVLPQVTNAQLSSSFKSTVDNKTNSVVGGAYATDAVDLTTLIGNIINYSLGFLMLTGVIIILVAGFMWMTAGGNDDKVTKAKSWMINGIIGIIIVLLAYIITAGVFEIIKSVTR